MGHESAVHGVEVQHGVGEALRGQLDGGGVLLRRRGRDAGVDAEHLKNRRERPFGVPLEVLVVQAARLVHPFLARRPLARRAGRAFQEHHGICELDDRARDFRSFVVVREPRGLARVLEARVGALDRVVAEPHEDGRVGSLGLVHVARQHRDAPAAPALAPGALVVAPLVPVAATDSDVHVRREDLAVGDPFAPRGHLRLQDPAAARAAAAQQALEHFRAARGAELLGLGLRAEAAELKERREVGGAQHAGEPPRPGMAVRAVDEDPDLL
mmetsp:Transcript_20369/g.60741  ORF Transcript_20369/g.60741 Transcript_20369/m.60741 type:complete len:270 (+) Transcript_20369:253-1062(+)